LGNTCFYSDFKRCLLSVGVDYSPHPTINRLQTNNRRGTLSLQEYLDMPSQFFLSCQPLFGASWLPSVPALRIFHGYEIRELAHASTCVQQPLHRFDRLKPKP